MFLISVTVSHLFIVVATSIYYNVTNQARMKYIPLKTEFTLTGVLLGTST